MNIQAGDSAIRSTDTDALLSRLSAASLDYIHDTHSPLLLTPSQRRSAGPRPALINIGTHARTWGIDALVTQFVDSLAGDGPSGGGVRGQVLSLGAGTDARFWRMKEDRERDEKSWGLRWVEVDFAEHTANKARMVASKPRLRGALGGEPQIGQSPSGCQTKRNTYSCMWYFCSRRRNRAHLAAVLRAPVRPARARLALRHTQRDHPRPFPSHAPPRRVRTRLPPSGRREPATGLVRGEVCAGEHGEL